VASPLPADVVAPSGTVFREWNAAADGSGASYSAGSVVTQPASNLTLFAQWITTDALEKAITDAKSLDREHYVPSSWSTLAPALAAAETVLNAAKAGTADQAAVNAATAALTGVVSALLKHPDWNATTSYAAGAKVTYLGHVYVAQWSTKNQKPGDPKGAWAELGELVASAGDGVRAWTASWVYNGGEVVAYNGGAFQAKWYTRNQTPGDPKGAWSELGKLVPAAGDGVRAWAATTIYDGGEIVAYKGHTWLAQWYSRNDEPGKAKGPWKDLGAY
jgi:chitodextrinase